MGIILFCLYEKYEGEQNLGKNSFIKKDLIASQLILKKLTQTSENESWIKKKNMIYGS